MILINSKVQKRKSRVKCAISMMGRGDAIAKEAATIVATLPKRIAESDPRMFEIFTEEFNKIVAGLEKEKAEESETAEEAE